MEIFGVTTSQIIGIIFLAGVVAMLIAVTTPDYTGLTRHVWSVPTDYERLKLIGDNPRAWRWCSAWWAIGAMLNSLGFVFLAAMWHDSSVVLVSNAAALSFVLATVFWTIGMAYRMGLEPLMISTVDQSTELPDWFKPIETWSMYIMLFYLALGYLAFALLGLALLQTEVLPGWISWFSLIFGAVASLSTVSSYPRFPGTEYTIFGLPILLHLPPLIIGVAMLL